MGLVWPTTRGWLVGLSCIAWVAVSFVNRSVFPFLLAVGTVSLTAVSFVCAWLSLRGIGVRRGVAGDAAAGQMVALPLWVTNRGRRRRQPLVVIECFPFSPERETLTVVPPLKPTEDRLVHRRVLAMKRGEFALNRLTLRSGDPAGLFYRERRIKRPYTQVIYPSVEPIAELALHQHDAVHATTGNPVSASGMSQDFYGVREYNPMDGLRFIHWKSSARYGRLMVREFERNAVMSVAVLLDASEHFVSGDEHWSNLEYQIRAAASICHYCGGLYCDFSLAAGGSEPVLIAPKPAAEASHEVMYALATLKPGNVVLSDLALELARQLPRKTVVFCLSLSTPKPLAQTVELLREQGMDVRWFCARREAFAPGGFGGGHMAAAGAGDKSRSAADAAQLHPGMRLGKALSLQGVI